MLIKIPNVCKIFQMAIILSTYSKIYPTLKRKHLATLSQWPNADEELGGGFFYQTDKKENSKSFDS
jgi:hypothetical protein